jgi:glycosyltransferase involved in cell wall biosynthesis
MMAAWLARVPIRLHTVAGLPLESASGFNRKFLSAIESLTYAFATEVLPNSLSMLDYIREHVAVKDAKLNIIGVGSSNGIILDDYCLSSLDDKVLADVKKQIDYDPALTYLLFVGRVVVDKGIEELVNAYVKYADKHEGVRLIITGETEEDLYPLPEYTTALIENRSDIIATGFSRHVKYFMHLSDLFVFPSYREGLPNVLMQAALMQLPIVASRIIGNVDIVDHGENGFLATKGSVPELVEGIDYLLANPDVKAQYKNRLYKKVRTKFDRRYVQEEVYRNYLRHLNEVTR